MKCKNCGREFTGNYCFNCGQNASVRRFDFKYFLRESFFSSLDIEKGFFHSILILFKRPGHAIRDYLEGKRLSLMVPIRFLLIFAAIATFISLRYKLFEISRERLDIPIPDINEFLKYAEDYATLTGNIIPIPVFALFSWLFFRRYEFNYTENIILNIFISAQQLVILVIISPLFEIFPSQRPVFILLYTIITMLYNLWVLMQFFRPPLITGLMLTVSSIICAYIGQFILNYGIYQLLPQSLIDFLNV